MSKPLPTQNTFAGLAPPWSLPNLDTNFTNVWSAVDDIGTYSNVLTDTGSVNAIAVTPAAGITLSLVSGLTLDVIVANTTTSTAVTLNANSTGAKTILLNDGTAPALGSILASGIYRFVYNGTNYLVTPSPDSGTFTGTLTGFSGTAPSGTCTWSRAGKQVTLNIPSMTGTSNAATLTMTGLPAAIQPATISQQFITLSQAAEETGGVQGGSNWSATLASGSGTVTFYLGVTPSAWQTTGTKGVAQPITFTYLIN